MGWSSDHPRIRGEHSATPAGPRSGPGSSPHTRGAQPGDLRYDWDERIIPAYAGSTGSNHTRPCLRPDHPRIRGEHLNTRALSPGGVGSSPHTRGALTGLISDKVIPRIIPAYAGSTGRSTWRRRRTPDHPRIRGEHNQRHDPKGDFTGSSPHTRGAPGADKAMRALARIIPAYAGSTAKLLSMASVRQDHPRIRGEHDGADREGRRETGSSPHTRGARLSTSFGSDPTRIIPAYAGSTAKLAAKTSVGPDHPRIRGEHRRTGFRPSSARGSSPHTRGAREFAGEPFQAVRIIPAYAGSTDLATAVAKVQWGSSPHTRGARAGVRQPTREGRIIPAYAGSTPPWRRRRRRRRDHPRIRGEHTSCCCSSSLFSGSSPHTRGAPQRLIAGLTGRRIIPAYAGSTSAHHSPSAVRTDHPRIRGEHSNRVSVWSKTAGSSPHTRGAPVRGSRDRSGRRIIPAYAGSTSSSTSPPRRRSDHPRIRGEHKQVNISVNTFEGSSPHTRGAPNKPGYDYCYPWDHPRIRGEHPWSEPLPGVDDGSSPHTRGAPPGRLRLPVGDLDYPRIRGEHRFHARGTKSIAGSSPHTRGARGQALRRLGPRRIIPAYAGSTLAAYNRDTNRADHPRIRGEHSCFSSRIRHKAGSSPHTRGAQPGRRDRGDGPGIIPAYAGSTARRSPGSTTRRDHPRIRGEHFAPGTPTRPSSGSSPHTRGARVSAGPAAPGAGIIPAYAGSTAGAAPEQLKLEDHPRIRGEHRRRHHDRVPAAGSSPHTRGAPGNSPHRRPYVRIIPAYAGSTARAANRSRSTKDHPRIRGEHRSEPQLR